MRLNFLASLSSFDIVPGVKLATSPPSFFLRSDTWAHFPATGGSCAKCRKRTTMLPLVGENSGFGNVGEVGDVANGWGGWGKFVSFA